MDFRNTLPMSIVSEDLRKKRRRVLHKENHVSHQSSRQQLNFVLNDDSINRKPFGILNNLSVENERPSRIKNSGSFQSDGNLYNHSKPLISKPTPMVSSSSTQRGHNPTPMSKTTVLDSELKNQVPTKDLGDKGTCGMNELYSSDDDYYYYSSDGDEKQDQGKEIPAEYCSLGKPSAMCSFCGAIMWKEERVNKDNVKGLPKFSICCAKGRIKLPQSKDTPEFLQSIYDDKVRGHKFRKSIRIYNNMLSFTSMGGSVDTGVNRGRGPYIYKLNGVNHHRFGSLIPHNGDTPKFCQLYIYDTENELSNRMQWVKDDDADVDPYVLNGLLKMLDEINHLVKIFRMARDRFKEEKIVDMKIVMKVSRSVSGRENHMTPSNEVAALIVGDADDTCGDRDIIIESKTEGLKRISDIHPLRAALQYPLLFPYADDGFHPDIMYAKDDGESNTLKREKVTMREYYSYILQVRPNGGMTVRIGGRLFQQYVVDCFATIEQSRLWWIRCHQQELRSELYNHIQDYLKEGDGDANNVGKGFILPSSFVGSRRYMQQNFQDALAICRAIGHPDIFLTMTCNPLWDEVEQMMSLLPGCSRENCPDILARVFKLKVDQLCDDIKKKHVFGRCMALMYVVEYQKRGLPHIHMLIWLTAEYKPILNNNVDRFVSAEIPDPENDPHAYEAVKKFMIHGPCGEKNQSSACMKDKRCTKFFPKAYSPHTMFDKSGFPIYMRRRNGNKVFVRKSNLDNQWVVPYNRYLLLRYQCHMNVEICNHATSLKYLFKYCLKGHDRATVQISGKVPQSESLNPNSIHDEIKTYLDGRYVCGAEAAHRIMGFLTHYRSVSVERLPFHLEDNKPVTFRKTDDLNQVFVKANIRLSKLEAFFKLNREDINARQFTYQEIPQHYVWDNRATIWSMRKRGTQIGRLSYTHYSTGDLWYLRMLLTRVKGATSFTNLRTVEGIVFPSFKDTCHALGLLADDNEYHDAIIETSKYGLAPQLRQLFVHIITNCQVNDILQLWEKNWECMSDDMLSIKRRIQGNPQLCLPEEQIKFLALAEIDKLLKSVGKSLKNFNVFPELPTELVDRSLNNLIHDERSYDKVAEAAIHAELLSNCNKEQRLIFDEVMNAIHKKQGGVFFVYGSGGCGKTYLWRTIISHLRSQSEIVLPVASSGIAATLLPGGRTAHSRFLIPILLDETSSCNISHKSDIAELLKQTSLIIWDEAPVQHKYVFECVDRSLRDIMKSVDCKRYDMPFGGITVLLGGDFRQILPVIPRAQRSEVVSACITRSRIWRHVKLFVLEQNMRLHQKTMRQPESFTNFAKWVLDIGNGKATNGSMSSDNEEAADITIPAPFCSLSNKNCVDMLIESTYPNLLNSFKSVSYLSERAILTPTNQVVDYLNSLIVTKIPGDSHSYYSIDTAEEFGGSDEELLNAFPVEYLNSIKQPGIPPYDLILKPGIVVMLIRNLNQILGLCNGTRMIVRMCLKHSVMCEVITGSYAGTTHFIPRIDMCPTDTRLPFKLCRKQIPLQICFAMTINKSQGQSLKKVGLYLPKPVFCHGQLYVAVSRVTSPAGLSIFIEGDDGKMKSVTKNVVYEEVFYNLHVPVM